MLAKQSRFEQLTLRAAIPDDTRWWSISGCPQFDASGQFSGFRGIGVDITEQRRSTEYASRLAMYDSLTGLPNRLRMTERLEATLSVFDYHAQPCAVMLIDLDRFKQVNDTLGHPAGDALLKQVAERLLRIVGDRERVFRLGGDEFQIIIPDCSDRAKLGQIADTIITDLSQPYLIEGSRCIIGASIGVAISPSDGRSQEDLIRNADLALYAAKASGRGRFSFFSNELLKAAEDKRMLEEDLRDALAKGEIQLFYQPIVNASSNTTTGVEALVRWFHPTRGPISPALFIPIAEETDLIGPLGEWVLRTACEDAAKWPGTLRVAVNVSPTQFTSGSLPAIVTSALAASGLPADRLELEITEGVFLSESAETDTTFATLKAIGVRLALDDFGTGYSSLGYLRTAPFDKIKIDQSFVRAATLPGSRNGAIIAAIVALAETLGMETTAEGVEFQDQLELIRNLRVSHVQGYIYSKAISCAELIEQVETDEWVIVPVGPTKQRSDRQSMYRYAGAIFGNHYRTVLIRNLSESGALIEGLDNVAIGSPLIIDFGNGELVFARVRRSRNHQQGVEFEEPLVGDGNGAFRTNQHVSPYLLQSAGLPSLDTHAEVPVPESNNETILESFRVKLGMSLPQRPLAFSSAGLAGHDDAANAAETELVRNAHGGNEDLPTMERLAELYLDGILSDERNLEIDSKLLKVHILPRFGHLRADNFTPSSVTAWVAGKAGEKGFGPDIISRVQLILGQLFMLAMQQNGSFGVSASLQKTSVFSRRRSHDRCLTPEEITRLDEAARASVNPQLKYIVALLMLTGARQRELLEAKWDHIDLVAGRWHITSARSGNERSVELPPAALDIIRALPRWDCCEYLIANPRTRRPFRSLSSGWDTVRTKAGLADMEIDDLRYTAIA
jgi:diguanylate cyclase (GGDEF)-like protein